MSAAASPQNPTTLQRYVQLAVIIGGAGPIYPLIYLRQNFEVTILESFGMTTGQLLESYEMLGWMFVLTYLPSGWLADRVPPRFLMSFSLVATALLGIWFSTMPEYPAVRTIFIGWGITTGLTFWSALIKAVAVIGKPEEQGRFFGILDGGRGLFEAILATIAVALFAYWLGGLNQEPAEALRKVIWFYVLFMFVMAPVVLIFVKDNRPANGALQASANRHSTLLQDLRTIMTREEIWLSAICILTGYQLFWATYSFSAYMQTYYGLTAVAVASITVAKLWMRPIGAAPAGFAGDFLDRESVLGILLLLSAVSLASLIVLPANAGVAILLGMVLLIGILTYGVRGIFWSTLESCDISDRIKGLAIGVISLLGYSPDIYLPLINAKLLERFPGKLGYSIYFAGIALCGVLGALAAWRLKRIIFRRERQALPDV